MEGKFISGGTSRSQLMEAFFFFFFPFQRSVVQAAALPVEQMVEAESKRCCFKISLALYSVGSGKKLPKSLLITLETHNLIFCGSRHLLTPFFC